jgi:sulfite dehydrogenase (quinone) subunit SoeC
MNPAWSVVFLTTLIGVGQGLFLALFGAELAGRAGLLATPASPAFLATGGVVALGVTAAGLLASFFHLGRPERAWRAAAMWRTSWLSREVIALPVFMALLAGWALAHALGMGGTGAWGALATLACLALFMCTGMVYASVRFLQEWASAYTLVNTMLLGLAAAALGFTLAGALSRWLSLQRNAALRPKSTLQSAIGVRHPKIRQIAMGFMGGSFNTREFFHGRSPGALRQVKWGFLVAAFVLPALLLLATGWQAPSVGLLALAFVVQYAGLLAERWFFLAQANHPQNLYYQAVS